MKRLALVLSILALGLGAAAWTQRAALHRWLFDLTGEEQPLAQARGLGQLASDIIRPRLKLAPEAPMRHNGVNPYGINTFLQHEVEEEKRDSQVRLIAEAGFHWIRQEFPWADIEIGGKGNFEDCRHGPCISAWKKYDHIVDLAEQYDLAIVARLSSPPDWSRADGAARGPFAPPDHFDDFADFAAAVAGRYRGRVRHYQIWNEPNGNDEWGYQPVDPEAYTRLLCRAYERLKAVDSNIVVIAAALTPTNELGGPNPNGLGGNNLNDLIFLQRMYDAGAADCFDVMSVQGYGLYSGPTDRRMRPIIINYGRNQFVRDIMVANGDAHKAIWIAEMNWNTAPAGVAGAGTYGQVTEAQQARYAPLAYQRAQAEWPWVGANMFWFFKRADDSERGQAWYYFRMAEPDFTLLPVYHALKVYMHRPAVIYPGWFQEDHWAVAWSEGWAQTADPSATFGELRAATRPGASARFTFAGTDLTLVTQRGPRAGTLSVRVDGGSARAFELAAATHSPAHLGLARGLPPGEHTVEIVSTEGDNTIDGFIVRRVPDRTGALAAALLAVLGALWWAARRATDGQ